MRKIKAAGVVWRMGETKAQTDAAISKNRENYYIQDRAHNVMLTENYYIGVYPVTLGQYTNMCTRRERGNFNRLIDEAVRPFCPIDNVTLEGIRGTTSSAYRWPEDGRSVGPDSAIKAIRDLSLLDDIDLPTEVQWEFACRGGTSTSLNSGEKYSSANCEKLGWISTNSKIVDASGNKVVQVHPVGLKKANGFGLYDMHGNVMEATLSRRILYTEVHGKKFPDTLVADHDLGGVTVDPGSHVVGEVAGIIKRGGSACNDAHLTRSGHREGGSYYYCADASGGFRLYHPAIFK